MEQPLTIIRKALAPTVLAKVKNVPIIQEHIILLKAKIKAVPEMVFVELTNYCGLRCKMCNSNKRAKGFMDWPLFKKVIDELAEMKVPVVYLHYGGDSLLHPQFKQFLTYAATKRPNIKTLGFINNGMNFTKDIAQLVIDLNIDLIQFSVDGLNEVNDNIRLGSSYKVIAENIEYLMKLRGNNCKPEIVIAFTWSQQKEEEVNAFVKVWINKVDGVYVNPCVNRSIQILDFHRYANRYPIKQARFCLSPFSQMGIFFNGDVVPCCTDMNGQNIMGNVTHSSIMKVWKGQKFRELRKELYCNQYTNDRCSKCNVWKPRFPSKQQTPTLRTSKDAITLIYEKENKNVQ